MYRPNGVELRHRFFPRLAIDLGDDHRHPGLQQMRRRRFADALPAPGDNDHLSLERRSG